MHIKKIHKIGLTSILVLLLLVQIIFYFLQSTQVQTSLSSIKTLMRQEVATSNLYLMSRTLSDLHENGMIKCVFVINTNNQKIFFDLRFKDKCSQSTWLLGGEDVIDNFSSLNGERWEIHFTTVNGKFFYISLWLARSIVVILVCLFLVFLANKEKQFLKEREKSRLLKEITDQAAHDVASPLSLLNAIVSSGIVSGDVKDYLSTIRDRVKDIVGGLKEKGKRIENSEPVDYESIELVPIVQAAVMEKLVLYKDIVVNLPTEQVMGLANNFELRRVLSNVLNNAIEASRSGSKIEVTVEKRNNVSSVSIRDFGVGIPDYRLKFLGEKGQTFGKTSGSGLGLYHAFTTLRSWGGDVEIVSRENEGTTVIFTFKS